MAGKCWECPEQDSGTLPIFEVTMKLASYFAYVLAGALTWVSLGQAYAVEGELQAAQKLASETGRPLLVVAGTDT